MILDSREISAPLNGCASVLLLAVCALATWAGLVALVAALIREAVK